MALIVEQFIFRSDNFGVLLRDDTAGVTASIDAPDAAPIKEQLDARGWNLDHIFTTHHHEDHVEGNVALKRAFGARVTAPAREADKIPGVDVPVAGGDSFAFGNFEVRVIDTPGHTAGHISYFLPEPGMVFVGDTLFALGCGRLFEGTPEEMWASLQRLASLPDETLIYCGHEYTETNARFALTIEPENAELAARAGEVARLRAAGRPTLPTTIGLEKRTNPFLRAGEPAIRARLGMVDAPDAAVFAEVRRRKDSFR